MLRLCECCYKNRAIAVVGGKGSCLPCIPPEDRAGIEKSKAAAARMIGWMDYRTPAARQGEHR